MFLSKRKRILLLMLWVVFSAAFAQGQNSDTANQRGSHHVYLSTAFEMNATGLTNEFIGDFYYGRYLTEKLRHKVSGRIHDGSIAGYRLDGGLYYFYAPADFRKKVGYYIGIEEHSLGEIRFNRNFFDLIFMGNEDFVGQEVRLSGLYLNLMSWQQFKAGIFKAFPREGGIHQAGFGLAFNKGQQHQYINVRRASFFTQEDAEYLELTFDMDVCHTDSADRGPTAFNGYGISGDLSYNFTDRKNHEFHLRASNIGYIRWDRSPDNFHRDTVIRFEGFEGQLQASQILWPGLDSTVADSVTHAIYGSNARKPYTVRLPTDLDFAYTYTFPRKHISVLTSFRLRLFSVYKPLIMIKPGYRWFMKKSSIGVYPVFMTGGYGNYNIGLYLNAVIAKKFFAEIGFNSLNSVIFPKSAAGLAASVTLQKTF